MAIEQAAYVHTTPEAIKIMVGLAINSLTYTMQHPWAKAEQENLKQHAQLGNNIKEVNIFHQL